MASSTGGAWSSGSLVRGVKDTACHVELVGGCARNNRGTCGRFPVLAGRLHEGRKPSLHGHPFTPTTQTGRLTAGARCPCEDRSLRPSHISNPHGLIARVPPGILSKNLRCGTPTLDDTASRADPVSPNAVTKLCEIPDKVLSNASSTAVTPPHPCPLITLPSRADTKYRLLTLKSSSSHLFSRPATCYWRFRRRPTLPRSCGIT